MSKSETDMIDAILANARAQQPQVSDDLLSRVLADAARMQPQPAPAKPLWSTLLDMIGGWPSIGGLAVAGVAGVWVGFAPPAAVSSWTNDLIGTTVSIDLLGDGAEYFAEGLADG